MLKLKLESAKVSLDTTSLSAKKIASALHFYDEFHFSKLFKKTTVYLQPHFDSLTNQDKKAKSLCSTSFNMFKLGHDDDANDYQKEPRADLTETHQLPGLLLIWVFPSTKECGDILR